jgi:hypothetical protein
MNETELGAAIRESGQEKVGPFVSRSARRHSELVSGNSVFRQLPGVLDRAMYSRERGENRQSKKFYTV